MVTKDECYQLMNDLNQARQAIGKVIDHDNTLVANIDFEDFQALGVQFPSFDYGNFVRAIALAVKTARDMIAMPGVNAYNVNINVKPQIQTQCHVMRRAMEATAVDTTPRIDAPKPVDLTGPEWLAQKFPEFYAGLKYCGEFPPIWSRSVYGKELPELMALSAALGKSPEFHEGAKAIAQKEASSIFIGSIYATAKVDGINTAKTWHDEGQTFHTSNERAILTERIKEHNATNPTKFNFDVESEWFRAKALAAIHAYARIILPKPEPTKPSAAAVSPIVTNLNQIEG